MKPRLYIETTIVSYLTARPARDVIALARQQITQTWWIDRLPDFDPVVSQLVLDEAARGDEEAAKQRLRVLEDFPLLDATPVTFRLAAQFIRPGAMPTKAKDDALHLAGLRSACHTLLVDLELPPYCQCAGAPCFGWHLCPGWLRFPHDLHTRRTDEG